MGRLPQSRVMVTHITVLVGRITELQRPALPVRKVSQPPSQDPGPPFSATPMLFLLRRLLRLYLLCTNPFIALCDESCVGQAYFSGYGSELPVVPVVRRVFGVSRAATTRPTSSARSARDGLAR